MDSINIEENLLQSKGPFGDSDGTRADIKEIVDGFIDFSEFQGFSSLAFHESDKIKRIIIGKKGSGKTIYLRRIQDLCKNVNANYVSSINYDPPSTRLIIKICEWSNVQEVSELWTSIWKTAIFRAVYTHIFYSDNLKKRLPLNQKKKFINRFSSILPINKSAVSIYSQLLDICSSHDSLAQLNKYLDNPLWADFEAEIGYIIKNLPALFFFIDAVDEDYAHAPLHWLRCQKGLFYCVYRQLRNQDFGGRLHICISIRETVLAHVYGGEHLSRYIDDERVKLLSWDKKAIKLFLRKKIETLHPHLFLGKVSTGKTIHSLLGIKNVIVYRENDSFDEDIEEYIVRHTRLLPRDIINIGNEICRKISESLLYKDNENTSEKILKDSICKCSKAIAIETIAWCANQQTSDWMYNGAYNYYDDELYTSDQEMTKGVASYFRNLISDINSDRFDYSTIQSMLNKIITYGFRQNDNPFNILWQFGLLGYMDKTGRNALKEVFFSEISPNGFLLPENRDEYVFHSCLIDLLNIKPKRKPVYVGN